MILPCSWIQRLDWSTISLLNSGFNFSSTWEKSKRDWEQHGHSGSRGIWASSSGRKSPASRKSSNSSSRQLDPWWFWHWDQWCKWISTSSQSLPISSLATKQVGTFGFNFTLSSFALFHFVVLPDYLKRQWRFPPVQMALLNPWTVMALLLTMIRSFLFRL